MEKWKKTVEVYSFAGMNGLLLVGFYHAKSSDGEETFGLELEDVNEKRLSSAVFEPSTDSLAYADSKNPKELLKYRGIIIEEQGLPEDMKKGLVRLLQKIEEQ